MGNYLDQASLWGVVLIVNRVGKTSPEGGEPQDWFWPV